MSWIPIPPSSDFTIYNLPFGVFSVADVCSSPNLATTATRISSSHDDDESNHYQRRCATIIGETIIDLSILEEAGLFTSISGLRANVFNQSTLNKFIQHPKSIWICLRKCLIELLKHNPSNPALRNNNNLQNSAFYNVSDVTLHLPISIGDYTDFYASREHATNLGTFFRGVENALQPNWLHLPVGYHGRASTVHCSSKPGAKNYIRRPCGQLQKDPKNPKAGSIHSPCKKLDIELEVAAVVGGPTNYKPLSIQQAKDRIFGFVLMNDWSARDIQTWEYVPLGPFTSKNFATTISPWIVMTASLEGTTIDDGTSDLTTYSFVSTTSAVQQTNPLPLPYLQDPDYSSYDVKLTVAIQTSTAEKETIISTSNFRNMYWNAAQQLTHHSVSGCIMNAGDLLGSGTISGSTPDSYGSMLELSENGTHSIDVGYGETRKFLEDGDTIIIRGLCEQGSVRIGFGECSGTILPAYTDNNYNESENTATCEKQERYTDFVLYGYWRSSSTWRVRIALAAKSIEYKVVPVNLDNNENMDKEYLKKNPSGQVPLLVWTDTLTGKRIEMAQSIAIIQFLDEAYPDRTALIPKDPSFRACAFEIVELINSGIQPLQNMFYLLKLEEMSDGRIKANETAHAANEKGIRTVEELVKKKREVLSKPNGPYCLGTFSPTIVDTYVIPQLYNARRFNVDVDNVCPTLVKIDTHCSQHPWFQSSHPSLQPDAR